MDKFDGLLLVGLLAITIGCGLIYLPLGLIAGGIGCIALAILGARTNAPAPRAASNNVASSGEDKVQA